MKNEKRKDLLFVDNCSSPFSRYQEEIAKRETGVFPSKCDIEITTSRSRDY